VVKFARGEPNGAERKNVELANATGKSFDRHTPLERELAQGIHPSRCG
jgi:hypothetical protein